MAPQGAQGAQGPLDSPCSRAFFLQAAPGQRFCIYHPSAAALRGAVLYIHPFAEEMHCARRMAALQSRALAAAGFAVLQVDLLGCGDSSGDFADALWEHWLADVQAAACWLLHQAEHESGFAPPCLWLWGLRAGCLLARQAAERLGRPCQLLFWQPCLSGRAVLQQWVRLQGAADLLGNGAAAGGNTPLQRLQAGQEVELAGYMLTPALAQGLQAAQLQAPDAGSPVRQVVWFELSLQQPPALSALPPPWQSTPCKLQRQALPGPAFWQLMDAPANLGLLQASTAALCAGAT